MTVEHTSAQGYAVLRSFEGRALKAYRDSVGVWTIGYGNTNSDASVLGFTIKSGVAITDAQAESLLRIAVEKRYEPNVGKSMPGSNQPQFDAGISFHYNTGAITRASWVKSFVAKNMPAVHSQIMQWNKAGGRALAGLTRRRNREWMMISAGDYGPEGKTAPVDVNTGKVVATAAPAAAVAAAQVAPVPSTPAAATFVHNGTAYPGMMMLGDKGPEVADEQVKLIAAGYTDVKASGEYDAATEAAVRHYQVAHTQLHEDGVIGPATKATLDRHQDAKDTVTTATGRSIAAGAVLAAADAVSGGAIPGYLEAGVGVVIAGALAYTVWKYRDEIKTMFKKA